MDSPSGRRPNDLIQNKNNTRSLSLVDGPPHTLQQALQQAHHGEITDDDLTILTETGDVDGDGKISLMDFRKMLDFNKQNPEPEPEPEPET